ncbi:hypothetical protein [Marinifilum fragile]|uniref:hypothetical protein n=1 Tax=Marinifilum fragile TaxID=570161 RepID=UPI002AAB79B9|nr:hypothetical protein [Marinifilum fragile]
MNLENLGVQELNSKEMKSVDGGWSWDDFGQGNADGVGVGTKPTSFDHSFSYWCGYAVGTLCYTMGNS